MDSITCFREIGPFTLPIMADRSAMFVVIHCLINRKGKSLEENSWTLDWEPGAHGVDSTAS
jgi:hypothetical protein